MCQGEGANVALESDKEDEEEAKKVTFSIYNVSVTEFFKAKLIMSLVEGTPRRTFPVSGRPSNGCNGPKHSWKWN